MSTWLKHEDYTVAWIAVLQVEVSAVRAVLDKEHKGQFPWDPRDFYIYRAGEINGHNIVIATLPEGENPGAGAAAALVSQVKHRFTKLRFALLVGVAAGLPDLVSDQQKRRDIRLGDVLVAVPHKSSTGIVHYDSGADTSHGFHTYSRLAETAYILRSAIGSIRQEYGKHPFKAGSELANKLDALQQRNDDPSFRCPGPAEDELYAGDGPDCPLVEREPRDETEGPRVWYGNIGSGNSVMRNAQRRDALRDKYDLIGLEMEAAGVMNALQTGVIRGVCDYGDDRKNKQWQPYAAATAAVYARAMLCAFTEPKHPKAEDSPCAVGSAESTSGTTAPAPYQAPRLGDHLLRSSPNARFWSLLTVQGLEEYARLWVTFPKDTQGYMNYWQCREQFAGIDGLRMDELSKTWNQIVRVGVKGGADPNAVLMPRSVVLALLYMLHVKAVYPDKVPNSLRDPSIPISVERWRTMRRFDGWVSCGCGCRGEWNFGGERGMRRGPYAEGCAAFCGGSNSSYDRKNQREFFDKIKKQQLKVVGRA